jgi:hypothetical protein
MPRVSSDYDLEVVHPALARQWHPTRNGSGSLAIFPSFSHQLTRCLFQKDANGLLVSISGTRRDGFLCKWEKADEGYSYGKHAIMKMYGNWGA